jgi:ESX secretion-associated protein EspG
VVLRAPVRVPADLLAWLVTEYQLGELHPVLAPGAKWYPRAEHDVLREQVQELLLVQGWRDRRGLLEREVAAALTVVCRPVEEFYGWINRDGATIGVLAGTIGTEAVLAVRHPDDTIWLTTIKSTRLAARLVAQTPDVPASPVRMFTVSPAELRATSRSGRQRTPAGVGVRRASAEVRRAQQLAAIPVTGFGELSTARRDAWGHRHRAQHPLRYRDTIDGRHALIVPSDSSAEDLIRIEPVTRDDLVRHLTTLHQSLPT